MIKSVSPCTGPELIIAASLTQLEKREGKTITCLNTTDGLCVGE